MRQRASFEALLVIYGYRGNVGTGVIVGSLVGLGLRRRGLLVGSGVGVNVGVAVGNGVGVGGT